MKTKRRKKEFDAVRMMRDIREKLSKKYIENPVIQDKELEEIRKKYGIKESGGSNSTSSA